MYGKQWKTKTASVMKKEGGNSYLVIKRQRDRIFSSDDHSFSPLGDAHLTGAQQNGQKNIDNTISEHEAHRMSRRVRTRERGDM